MLDTLKNAAAVSVSAAPTIASHSMKLIGKAAKTGALNGVTDLARVGVIGGGVALVAGTVFGVAKGGQFLFNVGRNTTSTVRQTWSEARADAKANKANKANKAQPSDEGEVIPPNQQPSASWKAAKPFNSKPDANAA